MDVVAVNLPLLLLTVSMAFAIALLVAAGSQPCPVRDAQHIWSLGLIAAPLGMLLLKLGELLGIGLISVMAKTSLTAAFAACLLSLAILSGQRAPWRSAIAPVVLVLLASLWFIWRYPGVPMRTGLLFLICSVICVGITYKAWRNDALGSSTNGRIVGVVFGVGAALMAIRAAMLFSVGNDSSASGELMLASVVMIPALATVGFLLSCSDRLLHDTRRDADLDELTGLLGRRAFLDRAQQRLDEAVKQGLSVAAVFIDVDDFKQINDRFGHSAGDAALRQIASALRTPLRELDQIGRLGGEEFGILLIGVTEAERHSQAQRLRTSVAELRFSVDNISVPLRVSIGVSVHQPGRDNLSSLLSRADQSMYRAKRSGRNQVAFDGVNA